MTISIDLTNCTVVRAGSGARPAAMPPCPARRIGFPAGAQVLLLFSLCLAPGWTADFRLGAMFPLYSSQTSSPPHISIIAGHQRFAAMRMFIEEINNKTDGILDELL